MNNLLKILLYVSFSAGVFSCKNKPVKITDNADIIYYTCPMDPQVVESKPGICPICHMALLPVKKGMEEKNNDELQLSPEQMRLGNIKVDTIRDESLSNQVVLTGSLNFDQTKINTISARVPGRIEKLYHKQIGVFVQKGTPLYEIYSEELNNAKQEYLLAVQKKVTLGNSLVNFDELIAAAKNKLLLWGMSEDQVRNIDVETLKNPNTIFYSTASGYLTELPLQEGDYVSEGGTIAKLAGLSTLWAEAQVYASQMGEFEQAKYATVEFPGLPGIKIQGNISFVNPGLDPSERINLVRVDISNNGNLLKPGMAAYVTIKTAESHGLALPSDAVLRDGKMATVWMETKQNNFKSVMVETGMQSGDLIEIRSGIQLNDRVVTSGAYLLQSEYIFRKGATPMGGMDMGGMKM